MNWRLETVKMGVPPGNRRDFLRLAPRDYARDRQDKLTRGVLEQYVAGFLTPGKTPISAVAAVHS